MIYSFEDVVDVVVYSSHSGKPFIYSMGGEFIVVVEVHDAESKAIKTSIRRECVAGGGCGVIGKFNKR